MSVTGDKNRIIETLTNEFQFEHNHANRAADRIIRQPIVYAAFLGWLNDRSNNSSLEIEGFTVEKLVEEFRMEIPGAFLTLAWLIEDPEGARAALTKGYDRIV